MSTFDGAFERFLPEFFELYPVTATNIGEHRHDGAWADAGETGRAARLAFVRRWRAEFEGLAGLIRDEAIDRDLILGELAAIDFAETELREDTWNPLDWVYVLGEGIFPLLARDFAPLPDRLTSLAGRLEGLGTLLGAAPEVLGSAGRPVGRFQTETALKQLPGIGELVDDGLRAATDAAGDPAVAAITPRLQAAATAAKVALATFEVYLRDVVLPASEGEARLGPELFAKKMRHTMRSDALTPERILSGAEREFETVRTEMIRLARELWPTWSTDAPPPDDDGVLVRGVLDAIGAEHPDADDLLEWCRAETAEIEAFCTAHDVIGIPDEPLDIRWTPVFLRAFGGAMMIWPGPLDKGEKSFFAITPMPDDWTDEQRESYLREDNARMLRLLCIHEAVPGHFLQGVYANRSPSLARAIFASGLFAEGWAVYVTQVMMDLGYGADDPALLLVHWKFYLRAVTNAIIDARIQAGDMDGEAAVRLMVDGGFQEESEARNKYDRARLSSTQLSTYFIGSLEMWDIELEARRRAAPDAVIEPRALPGGFGATPGFTYRDHLEAVIAHGTPPTSLLRRALFD